MFRRRQQLTDTTNIRDSAFADIHDWILSLPWVVERPFSPGIRCFGVECEPLGRSRLWLVTGMQRQFDAAGVGMAVIIPTEVAAELERADRGFVVSPMPRRQALMVVRAESFTPTQELEAIVLTAYSCAMS
jgi:hypothetical protein